MPRSNGYLPLDAVASSRDLGGVSGLTRKNNNNDLMKMTRTNSSRLAQSVEHQTLNLRVEGSSPSLGDVFVIGMIYDKTECLKWREAKSSPRFYRDLNSDRRIQSPEC